MWNLRHAWLNALTVGLLATNACSVARPAGPASVDPSTATAVDPSAVALAEVEARAVVLERHLAAREDEVAALETEVRRLREREAASRNALQTLKAMLQARAARPLVPYAPRLNLQTLARTDETPGTTGDTTTPAEGAVKGSAEADHGAEAERLKAAESQLTEERSKRQDLEAELDRLRRETSVGPYGDTVVDELRAARRKIQGLEGALASVQRARDELADKYEAARTQLAAATKQNSTTLQAQMVALQQKHREALASVEQELTTSRAREKELREALAAMEHGLDGASAAAVADLRAENGTLRTRLEQEVKRNGALTDKLKMASRVAEMIFKTRVGQAKVATQ